MEISTKYFDRISVPEEDVVFFEHGIFGFEKYKKFVLINFEPDNDDIMCLQSMQDSQLAFVIMNPFNIQADYCPSLSDMDIKNLDITETTQGVLYYVICVVKDEIADSTVNLKCPIVINPENKKAKQLILEEEQYTFRHRLSQIAEEEA
ncbi:MAG: flagellar assembly protein FliW [Proteocatella sp.]